MAPHGDTTIVQKLSKISIEKTSLHRTISDISYDVTNQQHQTQTVESAKCDCCGLSEEFTTNYVKRVREKHCGRMICGLCSEAVKMEMEKNDNNNIEAALQAHVSACARFNKVGRNFPVLGQAAGMREILRRSRAKSLSPRDKGGTNGKKGVISRSSSCIPAINKEI